MRHFSLLTFLVLHLVTGVAAGSNDDDAQVKFILDAIESNYSMISSAECTMHEVRRDSTVSQVTEQVEQLPNGGSVKWIRDSAQAAVAVHLAAARLRSGRPA